MSLEIYGNQNYKDAIRKQLKDQQKRNRSLTLRKLADLIPVQYTYLSKVMNHDQFHLNEDHLFTICKALNFGSEETEYLLVLRAWSVTQDRERKNYLHGQLESKRREKKLSIKQKESDTEKLATEMSYLLNPLCIVIHVAMSNQILRKNPQHLCSKLGITVKQLKEILKTLAVNDLVELESDQLTVTKTKQLQFHLGRNHPLMRVHQNLLKTAVINRLSQTDEEDKYSFMVTFTSNKEDFEKIKSKYQSFLKEVEAIAQRSQRPQDHQEVYHMNFDFFRWL